MTIDSVDEHLYRIGLCLTPNRHNTRRSLIFNPILITTFTTIFLILRIGSIFTDNRWFLLLMGDIGQFIGMRIYLNLAFVMACLFILSSQLIYYYNNNLYIRPTFLTLFHMMSGSVSPQSIGLNDEKQINKLISFSRKLFLIVKYQSQFIVPISGVIICLSFYIIFTSFTELLLYGITSAISIFWFVLNFSNFLGFQYLYFYLVCKYLDIKLKNINNKLIEIIKGKCRFNIRKILKTFNAIYCEIKEYDSTYISKFLFTVWLVVDTVLVIIIYIDVFIKLYFSMRIFIHYVTMVYFFLFIFTITTAASINYNSRITYKLLSSLYLVMPSKVKYSQHRKNSNRFKVIFNKIIALN